MIQTFIGAASSQWPAEVYTIYHSRIGGFADGTTKLTEAPSRSLIAKDGTLKNIRVELLDSTRFPGAGEDITVTVMKNGVATDLEVVISDTDLEGSNTSDTVELSAGDEISYRSVRSAGATQYARVKTTTQFQVDSNYESVFGDRWYAPADGVTWYTSPFSYHQTTTEGWIEDVMPTSGTLKNFYFKALTAPGSGNSWTFTLVKNTVDTDVVLVMENAETTVNDLVNEVVVAEDDVLYWRVEESGAPTASMVMVGGVWKSNVAFQYPTFCNGTATEIKTATDTSHYVQGNTHDSTLSGENPVRRGAIQAGVTIKKLKVNLATAPGTGKHFDFTLYKNNAPTALTVEMSDAETMGEVESDIVCANYDTVQFVSEPTGGPDVGIAGWSWVLEDTTTELWPLVPDDWDGSVEIKVDSDKVSGSGNLTDFPALIRNGNLPDAVYDGLSSATGDDLRFTTDAIGANEIPFEIVSIDTSGKTCEIWIKIPTLDYDDDTSIYVWYGNSDANPYASDDEFGSENVWDDNYLAVYHMGDLTTSTVKDSTSNGVTGTKASSNNPLVSSAGKIGDCQDFDGEAADLIALGDVFKVDKITVQAWVTKEGDSNNWPSIAGRKIDANNRTAIYYDKANDHYRCFCGTLGNFNNVEGDTTHDDINWHQIHGVISDVTGIKIYVDGAEENSDAGMTDELWSDLSGVGGVAIGCQGLAEVVEAWEGKIEEVRFSNIERLPDWIATEYANQNDPNSFWLSGTPLNPVNWDGYRGLKVDHTKVSGSGNLTDFTALIEDGNLPDDVYTGLSNANGDDLRFTTDIEGTTEIPFEIVSIDTGSKLCQIWVKIPTLDHDADTPIYAWYGNADAQPYSGGETYGRNSVWSDYGGVYHMETDGMDSAGRTAAIETDLTHSAGDGKIGAGATGSDDPNGITPPTTGMGIIGTGDFTVSVWVKPIDPSVDKYIMLFGSFVDGVPFAGPTMWFDPNNVNELGDATYFRVVSTNQQAVTSPSASSLIGSYHKIAFTRESGTCRAYIDGVNVKEFVDASSIGEAEKFFIFSRVDYALQSFQVGADYDEAYFRNTSSVSDDWEATQYANQNEPSTFWKPGPIRTVEAKASILQEFTQTVTAKGNILATTEQVIESKGNIKGPINQSITAKARIGEGGVQTITALGDIKKLLTQTLTSKGSVRDQFTQSLTAKGRIQEEFNQTITAKAKILATSFQTITAKGRFRNQYSQTITAKATLLTPGKQTITALGNIFGINTQTITAKARIYGHDPTVRTFRAIARINPSQTFIDEVDKTVRQISPKVEIRWDGVSWTDESEYFLNAQGDEKLSGTVGEGVASILDVELDNTNNRFTPGNTSSPIYAYIKPRVNIRMSITMGGYDYRMFTGYIKNIHPDTKSKICNLACFDNQVLVYNKRANGIVYEDNRSDQLLTKLTELADLTPSQFDFDIGTLIINFGYFEDRNVWPIMGEIAVAERGRVFFDRHGLLRFWNRSKLHNQTYNITLSLSEWLLDLDYSIAEHAIKNAVIVKAKPRANAGIQIVWTSGNAEYLNPYSDTLVWIPAGESQAAWLELEDPCTGFITPVRNTDFTANSEQGGSGDDLTDNIEIHEFINYGNAVYVTVGNTGPTDAYLTKFQVRGNPARILKWIKVTAKEQPSIDLYGRQDFEIENNFIQDEIAAGEIAYEELWRRKDALNLFRVNIIGIPYLLCGDVVNIEYVSGSFKEYMIEHLNWTLNERGFKQKLTLTNPYIFPEIRRISARGYIVKGHGSYTVTAKARILGKKEIEAKGDIKKNINRTIRAKAKLI